MAAPSAQQRLQEVLHASFYSESADVRKKFQRLAKGVDAPVRDQATVNLHALIGELDLADKKQGVRAALVCDLAVSAPCWSAGGPPPETLGLLERVIGAIPAPSAQFAAPQFRAVCLAATDLAIKHGRSREALPFLLSAVEKLQVTNGSQPCAHVLTPAHAMVMRLALASRCYAAARRLALCPVTEVRVAATGITALDVALYGLHAGTLCATLRDYQRAVHFFLMALTVPAQCPHAVAPWAHRKYILTSLLAHGVVQPLPAFVPHPVQRFLATHSKPYDELAAAYQRGDPAAVQAAASAHAEVFVANGDWGLVGCVVEAVEAKRVQQVAQTYLTLSVGEMAAKVGAESEARVEKLLVSMVQRGMVRARVDKRTGTVDLGASVDELGADVLAEMQSRIATAVAAAEEVAALDRVVAFSREYLDKLARKDKAMMSRLGKGGPGAILDYEMVDEGGPSGSAMADL